MKKKIPLSEREDLVQIKAISEILTPDRKRFVEGMVVVYGVIPGKEKELRIENRPNRLQQINYENFWKTLIRQGIVYRKNPNTIKP